MTKKKKTLWSVTRIQDARYPGIMLRVTEQKPGGTLFAVRMVNGKQTMSSMRCKRRDLGDTNNQQEKAAEAKALAIIEEIAKGKPIRSAPAVQPGDDLTLGMLTDQYELHGFHGKSAKYSKEQPAKVHRVVKGIGKNLRAVSLCRDDIAKYAAARRDEGIRQGTIASDIAALKIMLNWATEHKSRSNGATLLAANPLPKLKIEHEKRPRRPVADADRYMALRKVSDDVSAQLSLALDLAWHTGRRVGALLALKWGHISFDPKDAADLAADLDGAFGWKAQDFPHGGIRWYAHRATDNKVVDEVAPITEVARKALEQARPDITSPNAWVFPSPQDHKKPLGYHVLKNMLARAEKKAKLKHLTGGGFHPYRRGWATAHKHHPDADVSKLGGWRDVATMRKSYTTADRQTIRKIIAG